MYIARAEQIFRLVRDDAEVDQKTALDKVKELDPSAPGLGRAQIAQLEAILQHYEEASH